MPVITTLSFAGRTAEALDYYRDVLDAEIVFLMRFRDSPDQSYMQPGMEDLIFHATFRIDGTEFMASDVGYSDDVEYSDVGKSDDSSIEFSGFALALRLQSLERAQGVFAALSKGGQVLIPLARSAFTSWYAMVIDPFGVAWKINVTVESDATDTK